MSSASPMSPAQAQSPLLTKAPDQLKVLELREELKKRGLTPKGLKKELVERLEEALRVEEAQRKAFEAAQAPVPDVSETQPVPEMNQGATEMVKSEVTVVQETVTMVVEQPAEEIKGMQVASGDADAKEIVSEELPKAVHGAETMNEEERPLEGSRLAETISLNKPAETIIEDGPPETQASVDKPEQTMSGEKRADSTSVDMPAEMSMEVKSDLPVVEETLVTTIQEEVVVETVTVTQIQETVVSETETVVETVRVVEEVRAEEEGMKTEALTDPATKEGTIDSNVKHQKEESQESLAVDKHATGEGEQQKQVEPAIAPMDEDKRDEKPGEEAASVDNNMDSEAQAGLKRKEHEEPLHADQSKRQRRWNSGKDLGGEAKQGDLNVAVAGSNSFGSRSLADRTPKPLVSTPKSDASNNGRIVPQSTKIPTNSLRIDRFVRPFTLKALKDLLAETGRFSDFWIDHIKTHCYVTYSSVEEAVATRNALYNLKWPPVGGKQLIAEFVEPEEVKQKCEGGEDKPASNNNIAVSLPRAGAERPAPLTSPHSLFTHPAREKPQKREPEPIVTLDDLFKKTMAKPNIYYLPLTEAQVAAKRAAKA